MKKQLIAFTFSLLMVVGCGGSGGGGSSLASRGAPSSAKLTIHWPKSTRLIPGDAQCIEILLSGQSSPAVTLTNGTNYVTSPGSGGTSAVSTVQLAPGAYTVTAKAWPGTTPTGGGSPEASGTASLQITAGQSTSFGITMASTIDHVEVVSNGTTIEISTTGVVTAGNGGSATSLSIEPTLMNSVTVTPKDNSGDNLVLFPATLTGNEITNGDSKLLVGGAASNLSNTSGSVLTANYAANANAASSYNSSMTVKYNEGGSTLETFTVPVTVQAIQFGTPAALSVYSGWTAINAVTQPTATQYVMVAYYGQYSATAMTQQIQNGYANSMAGISPSSGIAFLDINDGYWLTTGQNVYEWDFGGTVNGPDGLGGVTLLANDLTPSGEPFLRTSAGVYEYATTSPITSTALSNAVEFGGAAAVGGGYDYWSFASSGHLALTSATGTDMSFSTITPDAVACATDSTLAFVAYNSGGMEYLECVSPSGNVIGSETLISSLGGSTVQNMAVFVDPTTGKVDGTAIGITSTANVPMAYGF